MVMLFVIFIWGVAVLDPDGLSVHANELRLFGAKA